MSTPTKGVPMLHWDEVRSFERAVVDGRVRCGATPDELEIEASDATTYRVLDLAKGRQLPLHVGRRVSADCLVLVDFRRWRYAAVKSFLVLGDDGGVADADVAPGRVGEPGTQCASAAASRPSP